MLLTHIIKNECPNCHEGHLFQSSNLFSYRSVKMNHECPVCHLDFIKEPGFYWGAMYASYGLAIMEAFITYFICGFAGIGSLDTINLWIMIGAMIVLSPFNFRMARVIWLYVFPGIERHQLVHPESTRNSA